MPRVIKTGSKAGRDSDRDSDRPSGTYQRVILPWESRRWELMKSKLEEKISDIEEEYFKLKYVGQSNEKIFVGKHKGNAFRVIVELNEEEARKRFKLGKDVRDWQVNYAKKDIQEHYPNKGIFTKDKELEVYSSSNHIISLSPFRSWNLCSHEYLKLISKLLI